MITLLISHQMTPLMIHKDCRKNQIQMQTRGDSMQQPASMEHEEQANQQQHQLWIMRRQRRPQHRTPTPPLQGHHASLSSSLHRCCCRPTMGRWDLLRLCHEIRSSPSDPLYQVQRPRVILRDRIIRCTIHACTSSTLSAKNKTATWHS